jgi:hypothetical protein
LKRQEPINHRRFICRRFQSSNGLSALAVAAADVATSSLTLEELIVRGLDSCSSPGDSDYDSAHDANSVGTHMGVPFVKKEGSF